MIEHTDRYIRPKIKFSSGREVVGNNGHQILDMLKTAADLPDLTETEYAELKAEVEKSVRDLSNQISEMLRIYPPTGSQQRK